MHVHRVCLLPRLSVEVVNHAAGPGEDAVQVPTMAVSGEKEDARPSRSSPSS